MSRSAGDFRERSLDPFESVKFTHPEQWQSEVLAEKYREVWAILSHMSNQSSVHGGNMSSIDTAIERLIESSMWANKSIALREFDSGTVFLDSGTSGASCSAYPAVNIDDDGYHPAKIVPGSQGSSLSGPTE